MRCLDDGTYLGKGNTAACESLLHEGILHTVQPFRVFSQVAQSLLQAVLYNAGVVGLPEILRVELIIEVLTTYGCFDHCPNNVCLVNNRYFMLDFNELFETVAADHIQNFSGFGRNKLLGEREPSKFLVFENAEGQRVLLIFKYRRIQFSAQYLTQVLQEEDTTAE